MTDKEVKNIIAKYLSNQASIREIKQLSDWLKTPENLQIFKDYINLNVSVEYIMEDFNTEEFKKDTLEKISKEQRKQIFSAVVRIAKHAAIIIIFLSLGYTYFNSDRLINTSNNEVPIVIENNVDEILLKLSDGTIKVIAENNYDTIRNTKGNIVSKQEGKKMVYSTNKAADVLEYNELTVPYGRRFGIVLSDGTNIFLNAGTTIRYPIQFIEGKKREVFLAGEAFFEVTKDKHHPFIVHANDINVEVLGTKFNVSNYIEDVNTDIILVEGAVNMHKSGKENVETIILKPGLKGTFNKDFGNIVTKRVNTSIYTSWIDGNIVFRKTPFENIIRKLERHYNVTIINNNETIAKELFNTTVELDRETIGDVLYYFNKVHKIEYEVINNNIIIK